MRFTDLMPMQVVEDIDKSIIHANCGQFLRESAGLPLFKALPKTYPDFKRVKIRFKRQTSLLSNVYNQAFVAETKQLTQRAVFAYPYCPALDESSELFYVFPVDGYRFLYSNEVSNSTTDYRSVVETIFEQFEDPTKASDTISDLLKYTYACEDLHEGMTQGAEIIVYGIPSYYVLRASAVPDYTTLTTI